MAKIDVELRNAEGLLIESAYLLGEFRKANLPPLVERRVTNLLRMIHAWLLDREIAKDPKTANREAKDDC